MKKIIIISVFFTVFMLGNSFIRGALSYVLPPSSAGIEKPSSFLLFTSDGGEVKEITAKEYIIGCIYAQIPISYNEEALKAQAVCAYTYALRLRLNNRINPDEKLCGADFSDNAAESQPYFTPKEAKDYYGDDYFEYYSTIEKAAEIGISNVISFNGSPIYAVTHPLSNGRTNTAVSVWNTDFPYLQSVESPWDKEEKDYLCSNEYTAESLRKCLIKYDEKYEMPLDYYRWFREIAENKYGYTYSVLVGTDTLSGGELWRIFGLRSTDFSIECRGNSFIFTTRGSGHGVGMSLYGANEMAAEGAVWQEIIKYYYTNVIII